MKRFSRPSIVTGTGGALTIAAPAVALAQTMPGTGPWGMHDGWFGWWPMGGLLWLVVVALLIAGLFAVVRWGPGQRNESGAGSEALKVLDERYARGEIEREDYLQRRKDIGGD